MTQRPAFLPGRTTGSAARKAGKGRPPAGFAWPRRSYRFPAVPMFIVNRRIIQRKLISSTIGWTNPASRPPARELAGPTAASARVNAGFPRFATLDRADAYSFDGLPGL